MLKRKILFSTYIFMINQFHKLKLPIRPFCMCHVLKRPGELFNRHILIREGIEGRAATKNKMIQYGFIFEKGFFRSTSIPKVTLKISRIQLTKEFLGVQLRFKISHAINIGKTESNLQNVITLSNLI